MSDFTRQCIECARVFEWSGRGRPPSRCERCKRHQEEREGPKKGGERKQRMALVHVPAQRAPLDIAGVMAAITVEIGQLEARAAKLREALAALEAIAELPAVRRVS